MIDRQFLIDLVDRHHLALQVEASHLNRWCLRRSLTLVRLCVTGR
jgi:hypothetical protein